MKDDVKITVMMSRETWARVRATAVRRGTTARALLTEAAEHMLEERERELAKPNNFTLSGHPRLE